MRYHLFSGQVYFSAAALLLLVVAADLSRRLDSRRWSGSVFRVVLLLSLGHAALSGTPTPLVLAVPTVVAVMTYASLGVGADGRRRNVPAVVSAILVTLCVAVEVPYHVGDKALEKPKRIVVIGDSLSSGGFGEQQRWPDLVAGPEVSVENLALPSDTAGGAVRGQLPELNVLSAEDLIMIEIGGNDMLGGVDAGEFEIALDELLGSVRRRGGTEVVMFELPIVPGKWRFGYVQRELARKYEVALIPKRVLAGALLSVENTSDGLHLTQRGHEDLARRVRKWAQW